jgi:hypothetical protein
MNKSNRYPGAIYQLDDPRMAGSFARRISDCRFPLLEASGINECEVSFNTERNARKVDCGWFS